MISNTFIFQFLNKIIYGIQYFQSEYQQQEFSEKRKENLKFHLKNDLSRYLASKNEVYEQNYNLHKGFIQDYCMMNPSFNQSFAFQQDNNCQLIGTQNDGDNDNVIRVRSSITNCK